MKSFKENVESVIVPHL